MEPKVVEAWGESTHFLSVVVVLGIFFLISVLVAIFVAFLLISNSNLLPSVFHFCTPSSWNYYHPNVNK